MKQSELYQKDISRHIEGVIKADEERYLLQEVDEYVITKELEKHIDNFFAEYVNKSYSSSAWISGFFGSGKSHLLKILSLVLPNREIEGKKCGEIFQSKMTDFQLKANLDKALKIPCQTILFNVDQKANALHLGADSSSILPIFLLVFNRLGSIPRRLRRF